MKIIEIEDISKTYHLGEFDVPALNGVSLEIEEGEFVSIMGASGSGKSTLLHILGLLDKPTSGSYKLESREISKFSDDELATLRNKFLGFVFQQFNLLPRTSAKENVELPLIYSADKKFADATVLLKKVGLADRIFHKPNELSGGQQQRVAIARALINNPLLIFADEPTGNLDSKSALEIIEILKELNNSGITIVMVTHEPDLASAAIRIITMQDGKIISDKLQPTCVAAEQSSAKYSKTGALPLQNTFSAIFEHKKLFFSGGKVAFIKQNPFRSIHSRRFNRSNKRHSDDCTWDGCKRGCEKKNLIAWLKSSDGQVVFPQFRRCFFGSRFHYQIYHSGC